MNLDRELLRQFYLKNGYADVRVVAGTAELDRDGSGFFINFAIEEGELYKFGAITIESSLPGADPNSLYGVLLTEQGDTYNGGDVDKTVEKLTLVTAEQGFAFSRVRPRGTPDVVNRTISINYVVDEGPRVYIERINIVGNERTKDFVIRREFRLSEGDAFNPLLVDRAKKRLQGLGFFKAVEVKRRPGSAPDRVVLDVELVEQSTGELSFGAGYSTSEGVIVHGAALPRQEPLGGIRPIPQGYRSDGRVGLCQPTHRRQRAARLPAVRKPLDAERLYLRLQQHL
jgi:outer membrane protein insertion porin family